MSRGLLLTAIAAFGDPSQGPVVTQRPTETFRNLTNPIHVSYPEDLELGIDWGGLTLEHFAVLFTVPVWVLVVR